MKVMLCRMVQASAVSVVTPPRLSRQLVNRWNAPAASADDSVARSSHRRRTASTSASKSPSGTQGAAPEGNTLKAHGRSEFG